MVKLTPKLVTSELPNEKLESVQKLALPGKEIEKIVRLSVCSQLVRLDLSNNKLTSLEGVSQNTTLKWLAAPGNQISSLQGLDALNELQVLNLSHNKLQGQLKISGMSKLRALMLNDNMLTGVDGLGSLPELNTLILKQNQIANLGTSLHGCTALAKLQVGHNRLKQLGSALCEASSLAELRVSYNEVTALPQELAKNIRLKIVEIGNNPVTNYTDLEVVAKLPSLHQLSLRGCPIAEDPTYPDTVLQHLPGLDVLDSRKLVKTGARYNSKPAATTLATGVRNTAAAKEADDISTHSSKGFKKPASVALQAAGRDVQGMEGNRAGNKQTKRQAQAAAESAADVTASDAAPGPSRKKQRLQFDEPQSFPAARADVAVEPVQDTNEADDPHKQHKASRKKASKAKHGGEQQKAHERSFLADVLDPEEDPVPLSNQPRKPAAKSEPNVEVRKRMVDSGLLKVIDTLPSKAAKGKAAKQTQGASVAPSGVAAVQLLQTGTGLDTLQVGLGASSSWD